MNCPFQLEKRTKASFWLQCTFTRYFFATENGIDFSEIKKQLLTWKLSEVKLTFDYLTQTETARLKDPMPKSSRHSRSEKKQGTVGKDKK